MGQGLRSQKAFLRGHICGRVYTARDKTFAILFSAYEIFSGIAIGIIITGLDCK